MQLMMPCEHRKEVTNKRSPSPKIESIVSKYRHSIYDTLVTYKSVMFLYKNLGFFCCTKGYVGHLFAPTNFFLCFNLYLFLNWVSVTKFFHGLISFESIFTCYLNNVIFLEGLGLIYSKNDYFHFIAQSKCLKIFSCFDSIFSLILQFFSYLKD
ncbi:hypothetical protein AMTRI_Chr07g28330 [Amborella trichopoda]